MHIIVDKRGVFADKPVGGVLGCLHACKLCNSHKKFNKKLAYMCSQIGGVYAVFVRRMQRTSTTHTTSLRSYKFSLLHFTADMRLDKLNCDK